MKLLFIEKNIFITSILVIFSLNLSMQEYVQISSYLYKFYSTPHFSLWFILIEIILLTYLALHKQCN